MKNHKFQSLKTFLAISIIASVSLAAVTESAKADFIIQGNGNFSKTVSTDECQGLTQVDVGEIQINSNQTATVNVANNNLCEVKVSMSSYKIMDERLSHQKFISGVGAFTLQPYENKTMTVSIAPCATQIDVWNGQYPTILDDSNPYSFPNDPYVIGWKIVNKGASCDQTPVCKLQVNKTSDKAIIGTNEEVTFTIQFTNVGTANCTGSGVHVIDQLDNRMTFVREDHSDNVTSSYNHEGTHFPIFDYTTNTSHWGAGTIVPGQTEWVSVTARPASANRFVCGQSMVFNQAKATAFELDNFSTWIPSNTVMFKVKKDCRR
jgi:uncharacterized repeat protein (TIGR01451 family)